MKQLTIFFDCHGYEIIKNIMLSRELLSKYEVNFIQLNNYVVKGKVFSKNNALDKKDIDILIKSDILILQVIEKDRGYLNNINVIKYCKKNCQIIKIPHYRNSIYSYKTLEGYKDKYELIKNWQLPKKITNLNNQKETVKQIKKEIKKMNSYPYNKNDMDNYIKTQLEEFSRIDSLSDIKMNNFFLNNYKKYRLFQGRSYPSSFFFFELANNKINNIRINQKILFVDNYYAENTSEPIPNYWYKFNNFEFDNIHYVFGHLYVTEYEWYYILLLSNNINILSKEENINYLSKIRNN